MPPCGYRAPAVAGISLFLSDNLDYFIELYRPQGLAPKQAIATELAEIQRIKSGVRGGRWSAVVVDVNRVFYEQLGEADPVDWTSVERIGHVLIDASRSDLESLLHDPSLVAA